MSNSLQRVNQTAYLFESPIEITGLNLDAFERQRVSLPMTQYEYNFQYNEAPLIWQSKTAGSGTATHRANEASVRLSTGITRTTSQYKQVGYYDDKNGVIFGQDNDGIYFILRSYASGSKVDRKVYQSEWNIDKMDGTGKYPTTIDIQYTQILVCQLQWLGVGTVTLGFEYNGIFYPSHQYYNTNILQVVYMTTANLPMRYEIVDGSSSVIRQTYRYFRYRPGKSLNFIMTFNLYSKTTNYLDQICATVITDGSPDQESYYQHSVNNGITALSVSTTLTNLISIRPKATFNSVINRGQVIQEAIEILCTSNNTILWSLVYNPTLSGTPTWLDAGNNSIIEYTISNSTVTNGEILDSGYLISTNQIKQQISSEVSAKYPLTLDMDGLNPKILTLCARAFTSTADMNTSMTVREYY
jgi:hypothetical protein